MTEDENAAADALAGVEWLGDILKSDVRDLPEDADIVTCPGWDSFVQLEIMLHLEERYDVEMTEENIRTYSALSNILRLCAGGAPGEAS